MLPNLNRTRQGIDVTFAVVTISDAGAIVSVVPRTDRIACLQDDSLIGLTATDFMPEEVREPFEIGLRQLRETGSSWLDGQQIAFTLTNEDGGWSEIELDISLMRGQSPPALICTVRDKTARLDDDRDRMFQSALLTAQHQLSLDGIVIVSPEDDILFYNERYCEVWDIPVEVMETGCISEVRKVTATRVVDPEGVFYEGFQRYDSSREIAHDELHLTDGRILARHSAPILAEDNSLLGRFWSYRDITDYRRLQRLNEEQAERLSALVTNHPDMVMSLDLHGTILSANPATESVFGYTPEEIVGRNRDILVSPESRDQIYSHVDEVDRGQPQRFETSAPHKDGHGVDVSATLIPILVDQEPVGHWAIVHDNTDAKRVERERHAAQASLEAAQRLARLGSFEWDSASDRLVWSRTMYDIFGLEEDSFVATLNNLLQFIHQDDQQELMNRAQRTMSEFVPYEMDVRIIRPTGEQRYLQAQGEAVIGEDGKAVGMVGTALDITERKREEDALHHLVSLLEEKSRALELTTAEQQSFIYSVSHDLRSPLISIQGMAEIIQTDYADTLDETAQRYLGRILANVRRLQDMLSGLLELSRIGRTEKSSRHGVDLQTLVPDIVDGLRESQAGQEAEIDIDGELPTVWAHSSRMSQLFTNLIDNALKYTPPGRRSRVAIRAEDLGDLWRISVSDNGIGIPSEHRNSAVSMFSRLPQGQRLNPGGSGLGLAIVLRIVAIYGGVLTIDTAEREGTKISFTLPKMRSAEKPSFVR